MDKPQNKISDTSQTYENLRNITKESKKNIKNKNLYKISEVDDETHSNNSK